MRSTSRNRWWRVASAAVWLALVTGCEPGISVPDPPSGSSISSPATESNPTVPTLGVSLPEPGVMADTIYKQAIRRMAAEEDSLVLLETSPPEKQAETVRELARRGLSALLVLPGPGSELGSALEEVRTQGLPILIFGRPAPPGAEDLPRVEYTPFDQSAREIVQAAQENAREAGFPEKAPAVILVNGPYDADGRDLLDALRRAIEAAGIPTRPDVVYQGFQTDAEAAFKPFLERNPEIAMAFVIEDHGLKALAKVRDDLDHQSRRFVIAGFAFDAETARFGEYNLTAAIALLRPDAMARQAVRSALDLASGRSIPEPVEVKTPITRGRGPEREGYRVILIPATPVDPTDPTARDR